MSSITPPKESKRAKFRRIALEGLRIFLNVPLNPDEREEATPGNTPPRQRSISPSHEGQQARSPSVHSLDRPQVYSNWKSHTPLERQLMTDIAKLRDRCARWAAQVRQVQITITDAKVYFGDPSHSPKRYKLQNASLQWQFNQEMELFREVLGRIGPVVERLVAESENWEAEMWP